MAQPYEEWLRHDRPPKQPTSPSVAQSFLVRLRHEFGTRPRHS